MKKIFIFAISLLLNANFFAINANANDQKVSNNTFIGVFEDMVKNKNYGTSFFLMAKINKYSEHYEKLLDNMLNDCKNNIALAFAHHQKALCLSNKKNFSQSTINSHLAKSVRSLTDKNKLSKKEMAKYYSLLLKMDCNIKNKKFNSQILYDNIPDVYDRKFIFKIKNGSIKDFKNYEYSINATKYALIKKTITENSIILSNLKNDTYYFNLYGRLKSGGHINFKREIKLNENKKVDEIEVVLPKMTLKYSWENNQHVLYWDISKIGNYKDYNVIFSVRKGMRRKGSPGWWIDLKTKPSDGKKFILKHPKIVNDTPFNDHIIYAYILSTEPVVKFPERDFIIDKKSGLIAEYSLHLYKNKK